MNFHDFFCSVSIALFIYFFFPSRLSLALHHTHTLFLYNLITSLHRSILPHLFSTQSRILSILIRIRIRKHTRNLDPHLRIHHHVFDSFHCMFSTFFFFLFFSCLIYTSLLAFLHTYHSSTTIYCHMFIGHH
ncbi:hypothetical protein BYT27DRAFT_6845594 [Phlegmacium glaucopus]|nr:hypothetical protein BYT27DRAFT_6845594 [Phlegmacium glaucopus]